MFVENGGVYYGLPHVDPWSEDRDARKYPGPHPVVAHPPCSCWCRLAGLVEARWGHKKGEDGGCFAAALTAVQQWGGVLEHPAYSDAWKVFGLTRPPRQGGWIQCTSGALVTHVEQCRYGHPARKATWLYAVGTEPIPLLWGMTPNLESRALVSHCGNGVRSGENRPRVSQKAAARTPIAFRDTLIAIAESAIKTT